MRDSRMLKCVNRSCLYAFSVFSLQSAKIKNNFKELAIMENFSILIFI